MNKVAQYYRELVSSLSERLRHGERDIDALVTQAVVEAISRKPKGHDFVIERARPAAVPRHMSVTGG